ncbi:NADPH-dependent FMN reductase [Phenylobacterium sp.]|jgi:chromate reductase|uniref:NADPH-dependent FMN reductase n=1 Tax=Phenylobacterium sp. TaxID=1871053 RepID=UPI002E2EF258|nr:NADPH-dependent FMN reductase [Phenylobacterium sp.]HEX4711213.1 NADPH-dependent FMN reductase [Phenylobacterium sp.]
MSQHRTVAVIVGSLRKDSVTRKVARALEKLTPDLKFTEIEIGNLQPFNQDLEATPTLEWVKFREQVKATDALLFATPEYNRSVPGVLKNAIDVGSRPYGSSVWDGKPGAVISVSPGGVGGFGANHHLRQSLVFLNVPALPVEAYIGNAFSLFDAEGELINDATADFLKSYGEAFSLWIEKILADEKVAA